MTSYLQSRRPPAIVRVPWLAEIIWSLKGHTFLSDSSGAPAPGQWCDPTCQAAVQYRALFKSRLETEPALLRSTLSTLQHFEFGGSQFSATYRKLGLHHRPVLVLWGTEDLTCPFTGAAALRELLPRARVVPLVGLGHSMPLESDGAVAVEVATFIEHVLVQVQEGRRKEKERKKQSHD